MSDAMQSHLERFPEGAIEVAQGRILDFNRAAQAQFPELAVGMEAPEFLSGSLSDPEGAGTFAHNGSLYLFSRVSGTERDLLLFRPAPQSPLTQGQLDGFVRQMRGFLQDILLEFETVSGPSRGGMDAFSKSFCRVYRLLSNLDFLRSAGAPEGVPFRPVTMDLAGLCRSPIWAGASRRESRSSSSFGSSPRCPESSSDTVSPRQSPRGSSRDRSGKFRPRSHLLTAWADTWRAWESSFWVSPLSRRAWAISAPVF